MFQLSMYFGPWALAALAVWFFAHIVGPYGYQVPFGRGVLAVVMLRLAEMGTNLLQPFIGSWTLLCSFIAFIFVIRSVLWLNFRRSTVLATIYFVLLIGMYVGLYFWSGKPSSTP
jgi:hypothetical protein